MSLFNDNFFKDLHSSSCRYNGVPETVSSKISLPKDIEIDFSFPSSETLSPIDDFVKESESESVEQKKEKKTETKEIKKQAKGKKEPSNLEIMKNILKLIKQPDKFDINSKTRKVTINGKEVVVNINSIKKQKDGTFKVTGKSEDGNTTTSFTCDKKGKVKENKVTYRFADGATLTEIYRESGETYFKGYFYCYKDENGIQKGFGENESRNIKTGGLIEAHEIDENDTEGFAKAYADLYSHGAMNSYMWTDQLLSYKIDDSNSLRRRTSGGFDEEGKFVSDGRYDEISILNIDNGEENPVIHVVPVSVIKGDFSVDMSEFTPDNGNTCKKDIIANGGQVESIINGETKTEFVKNETFVDPYTNEECSCEVVGYTRKDKDGKIMSEHKVYYDAGQRKICEQTVKYDSATGLHYGRSDKYTYPDGVNAVVSTSYMQGNLGSVMRYTEIVQNEDGTYSPSIDTDGDIIRFKDGKIEAPSALRQYIE